MRLAVIGVYFLERMKWLLEFLAVVLVVFVVAVIVAKLGVPGEWAVLGAMYVVGGALQFTPPRKWPDVSIWATFPLLSANVMAGIWIAQTYQERGVQALVVFVPPALVAAVLSTLAFRHGLRRWVEYQRTGRKKRTSRTRAGERSTSDREVSTRSD